MLKNIISPGTHGTFGSLGLLILRIGCGGTMAAAHGWQKLTGFAENSAEFPDPLGFGSVPSMALTVFAEFFCALAVVLGLFTRVAVIPLLVTMLVAFFVIHSDDPFKVKELSLLYAISFLALFFTGAGKFSLDGALKR
ncbi:MAG: DoxX family protein [Verrucomicrobiales bacterium]